MDFSNSHSKSERKEVIPKKCAPPKQLFVIIICDKWIVFLFQNGSFVLEDYKCGEFNLLGNFLVSDGKPGKV